jgi:hypothetical protein
VTASALRKSTRHRDQQDSCEHQRSSDGKPHGRSLLLMKMNAGEDRFAHQNTLRFLDYTRCNDRTSAYAGRAGDTPGTSVAPGTPRN